MSKRKTSKATGATSSPFVLVRSKTGREFQRCGMRFKPDAQSPVDLRQVDEPERITESKHLDVSYVSEADFERAVDELQIEDEEQLAGIDVRALLKERDQLRDEVATLRSEIALLTGRRNGGTGPREGDDKPRAASPLAMGG